MTFSNDATRRFSPEIVVSFRWRYARWASLIWVRRRFSKVNNDH